MVLRRIFDVERVTPSYEDITADVIQITPVGIVMEQFGMYLFLIGVVMTSVVIGYRYIRKYKKMRYFFTHSEEIAGDSLCINEEWKKYFVEKKIRIFRCEYTQTPFSMGAVRPLIVLPDYAWQGKELEDVLAHEMTHIRHKDNFWKLLILKMAEERKDSNFMPIAGMSMQSKEMEERIIAMTAIRKKKTNMTIVSGIFMLGIVMLTSSFTILAYDEKQVFVMDEPADMIIVSYEEQLWDVLPDTVAFPEEYEGSLCKKCGKTVKGAHSGTSSYDKCKH